MMKSGVQHGPIKTFDTSGRLISKMEFVEGAQEGESLWYGPAGEVTRRALYTGGKLNGVTFDYYSDGTVQQKTEYVDGEIEGETVIYDPEGEVIHQQVIAPQVAVVAPEVLAEEESGLQGGSEGVEEEDGKAEKATFSGFFGRFRGE
jgi:antitoxin component YwqK of YwqJK toxin-antitoxin module